MKILLISCYELGHQPFNLASPAAHLLDAGFEVQCLDLAVEPFDDQKVLEADFIAFSTPMHTALRLGVRAAKRVRTLNPDCHLCFYGLYAGMHAEHLLNNANGGACADSVVGGEFETPLLELAKSMTNGKDWNLPGVVTAGHFGETSLARQRFLIPARHLLPPLNKFAHLEIDGQLRQVGYVEASRGCAHKCLHCPITPVYEGRMRIIPKNVVLADIEQLVHMGSEHIAFGDPDFLNGVKHSIGILREMHVSFPNLTFDFTAKIEHILEYRDLISEFRELGCLFVVSALELLNDTILGYLDKGHTRADAEKAVEIMKEAGIFLRPSLMPFTPWTTIEDYLDLFHFVEQYELFDQVNPVQFSIRLLLPPGSSLLSKPAIRPYLDHFNEHSYHYEWKHPDPAIDDLHYLVSEIVENDAAIHEDSFETYLRIRELAFGMAGRNDISMSLPAKGQHKTPRLTEDWFC